jgi:hypothetical protein
MIGGAVPVGERDAKVADSLLRRPTLRKETVG